ncbi:MAG: hypothetical protein H0V89_11660 [Deltaproteobacteria bacterium]|nr:hypothetical protein [Deltaproteobacteria bacterium]
MRIGIRAEYKNHWERRVALTPDHVRELVSLHGVAVDVQPMPRRIFADQDYREAGADIDPDLTKCRVILGIKEIPAERILPGRTYVLFPHVTKGQAVNAPMLRRFLELRCTVVDYEQIVDRKQRRLVYFGRHAGYAGMIDTLWALGQRLAAEGFFTPLEHVRLAHHYTSVEEAMQHVSRLGEHIRHVGLPVGLRPIVVAFTGSGNVSRGAQEIYDRLPVTEIDPVELRTLEENRDLPRHAVFKAVLERSDRYRRIDGALYEEADFLAHPDAYESALDDLLPHLTVLVHGAFWAPGQPVLVRRDQLARLVASEPQPKLRVIGDITCDIDGSIASTVRATDPGDPVYVYDPGSGDTRRGVEGRGVVTMAVDNLPTELPADASQHFGDSLLRFVGPLARCDWDLPYAQLDLPPELHRAVIVHQGQMTPGYTAFAPEPV